MSIVMTGGGTGGHLAIVRSVKEALIVRDKAEGNKKRLVYIGSVKGQDRAWFENDEAFEARYFLKTQGVVNQKGFGKVRSAGLMLKAFFQARKLLREHDAEVVFSVGGFSAAPTALAAKSLGIPLVIHEQNAAIGTLNKLLKPYADIFISSYLEESPIRAYPVREIFFDNARIRKEVRTVLFLGGSQGARAINTMALKLAPELEARGIRILHQAGAANLEAVQKAYRDLGIDNAEVFGFSDKIPDYMKEADFAVARAGASTLWELAASALPALFVPYPYAAGDHQYYNAKYLADNDAAWVVRESDLTPESVLKIMTESDIESVSEALTKLVERGGAAEIAALLRRYA